MEGIDINNLIGDLALILVLAAASTIIFKLLKQPVVLGYIVAGFIASPHFELFPNVGNEANIEFWAQIGIIVLLFSLGLEFSFKKLVNVGGSAIVTTFIIVAGMMSVGFLVGKALGFQTVDSIFMGGMISMSSTTIILKALTDLNMRQRRFVPMTFAVLIVEDLFAVVMMVILSSIAINNKVSGDEMMASILQLSFFLVIWFTVGIFVIPSVFKRFRHVISDEIMLIISMGLCFLMVIFSVQSGFSAALGAFVMGSILAGTIEAERIERLVSPVKDLFGAVFFISVGMMVDPAVIAQYWPIIALLAVVVIVGMTVFGTFGMLASGQPLKLAMESGFSLTQIGEFSFIIATLGTQLDVLDNSIYPIIVSVSVITTFTTPFFIKQGEPAYNRMVKILPKNWTRLLNGYSKKASESEQSETMRLWKSVLQRYLVRMLIYSAVIISIIMLSRSFFIPFVFNTIGNDWPGRLTAVGVTLAAMAPFIFAIIVPGIKRAQLDALIEQSGNVSYVPIVIMTILSMGISAVFLMMTLHSVYSITVSLLLAPVIVVIAIFFTPMLRHRLSRVERRFVSNINERENRRTGRENTLVSDLHLGYMTVGHSCPFVGKRLRDTNLRTRYGVNLVNVQRNGRFYPVPGGDMRIFPGDVLGVIGTEEQIEQMIPLVEANEMKEGRVPGDVKFTHFDIGENSPLVGKYLSNARLSEDYEALLVAVQRGENDFIQPTPDLVFKPHDILWIVGDPKLLKNLAAK